MKEKQTKLFVAVFTDILWTLLVVGVVCLGLLVDSKWFAIFFILVPLKCAHYILYSWLFDIL